jgi:hypothetical protein
LVTQAGASAVTHSSARSQAHSARQTNFLHHEQLSQGYIGNRIDESTTLFEDFWELIAPPERNFNLERSLTSAKIIYEYKKPSVNSDALAQLHTPWSHGRPPSSHPFPGR